MIDFDSRFHRHLILDGVGLDGQLALRNAHVAIVGLGGLGSAVSLYLTAAGVGTLTLIDSDRVDESNLQRQILYHQSDLDRPKADCARRELTLRSPETVFHVARVRLDEKSATAALRTCRLIVDCTDNFETRFVLNRHCREVGLPLVIGACTGYAGQVVSFDFSKDRSPCYDCLYPEFPTVDEVSPDAIGVLSPLPGLVGTVEAIEAIALIVGRPSPLTGRLWTVDVRTMETRIARLSPDPDCDCRKLHLQ